MKTIKAKILSPAHARRRRASQRPCKRVPVGRCASAFGLPCVDADTWFIGILLALLGKVVHIPCANTQKQGTNVSWGFHLPLILPHAVSNQCSSAAFFNWLNYSATYNL